VNINLGVIFFEPQKIQKF